MTLQALHTETSAMVLTSAEHEILFEGKQIETKAKNFTKAYEHLQFLQDHLGFKTKLRVETFNRFPMAAGIASSASGLAALTLAAIMAWTESESWEQLASSGFDLPRLAHLSRIGSGSACRSLMGGYVCWHKGLSPDLQSLRQVQTAGHWRLCDTVILIHRGEKAVSSSEAHSLAWSSPLFLPRIAGLEERAQAMEEAIQFRKLAVLGPLLETEALEMHAVIMTASTPVHYLNQGTLEALAKLREARYQGELPAYFTIDAGPNVHVIHEAADHAQVKAWLETQFGAEALLHDEVGQGPILEAKRVD